MSSSALVAADVRAALWEALAPVVDECTQACLMWNIEPDSLRYLVQIHPLRVQIVTAAVEGRPASRIVAFSGERLPDGGLALAEAVETFAGGVLGALPEKTAERVVDRAAVPGGGLCIAADPATEAASLVLSEAGRSLDKAVVLGGIGEAVSAH